ncbi:hypothetical protein D3C76_225990 [compost metagenome]
MRIIYNKEFHLEHKNWTKEIIENFESFLVTAALLEYSLQKSTAYTAHINRYYIKLKNKKLIIILFDFSEFKTIDSISVLTQKNERVFTNNQFQEAIDFMKSLL